MKLVKYACDKCDSIWNHLYEDGETKEPVPCPACENKKNRKNPFYTSKFFRCDHEAKSKGCGFKFASSRSDVMYIECPNCGVNNAKRVVEVSAIRGEKSRNMHIASNLAFEEAQKQGFTNMKDSQMREGDIAAPPIDNAVTYAMKHLGMGTGWTGANSVIPGVSHSSTGSMEMLNSLKSGLQSGKIPDSLKTFDKIS